MKKVIFLIIASHDKKIYDFMRDVTNKYFAKMETIYNLKHFYVEFKDQNETIQVIDDTIYVRGVEDISNAIIKTHVAMKYLNDNYDYDILIRTNLSTFWNIPRLYEIIHPFENTNVATGVFLNKWINNQVFDYITGTGIMISKDICVKLCTLNLQGDPEDIFMSYYLNHITTIQPLPQNTWLLLMDGPNNKIPDDIRTIVHYRIKSEVNNRIYDKYSFQTLAKRIYNLDISID